MTRKSRRLLLSLLASLVSTSLWSLKSQRQKRYFIEIISFCDFHCFFAILFNFQVKKPLYRGGPVSGFVVLHTAEGFGHKIESMPGLYYSMDPNQIKCVLIALCYLDIYHVNIVRLFVRNLMKAASPDDYRIFSGFSRWVPHQLQVPLPLLSPTDPTSRTHHYSLIFRTNWIIASGSWRNRPSQTSLR